jgi:hypothetical protein
MGVLTQVIDAKWYYQLKNGDNFSLAPLDFSANLVADIFENVKLVATIKTFNFVPVGGYFLTANSLSLANVNFTNPISIGDRCQLLFSGDPALEFVFDVTSVSEEIIYFNLLVNVGVPLDVTYNGPDNIIVNTDLTYLNYQHGLANSSNSEQNYRSKLDDETTAFLVEGLGIRATPISPRSTATIDGVKTAINSNTGSFKARYLQNSEIPYDGLSTLNAAQNFQIEHIFRVQDYSEEDIQNYIEGTKPDAYLGENTLQYNSNFELRTVETNPATARIGTYLSKSSIGYFDENINGRPNKYTYSEPVITRVLNGNVIDDIASSEASKVTLTITGEGTPFASEPSLVFNHFSMISDYQFKNVDFDDLFNNDLVRVQGVSSENGTIITEAKITGYTPNTIDVEFTVNPNDSTLDDKEYILSILVGDSSKSNILPDKVQLKIKTGFYQSGFDIEGLLGEVSIKLFQRDCNPSLVAGNSSFPMIQGEFIYTRLDIPVIGGLIDSIELETIDFDGGDITVVDSIEIDTSSFVVINGEQEILATLPTPYSTGLDGLIWKVSTGLYQVVFPYRLPYSKERPVDGLSDVLFDQNEPNQGRNEGTYYQTTKGVNVHIAYKIGMLAEGRVTYYRYRTPALTINDFENTL